MIFHYVAADKDGNLKEGSLEVDDFKQALTQLAGQELKPISVKPVKRADSKTHQLFGGISLPDKIFLAKYLSLMLKVGTDLLAAIDILIADFEKAAMKNFLLEVRDNLSRGQPFYAAFARYPKVFSPVFINLVKAAETSGNLQETFDALSASLARQAALRNSIKSALVYPVILLISSLAIFIFLVTFALPKIAGIFLEGGIDPPVFSRVVFGIGLYINEHVLVFGVTFIVLAVFVTYFFWKSAVGRRIAQRIFSKLPLVRKVFKDLAVQRFASTSSSLMKSGLPIVQTIDIAADTVGVEEFQIGLKRISKEGLTKGLTVGEAFKRETAFPKLVTNLIAVSEKAGHLEEVLDTISQFYADKAEGSIKSLVSFLEPILLLVMGLLVGLVALSIIIPIYQLTSQF